VLRPVIVLTVPPGTSADFARTALSAARQDVPQLRIEVVADDQADVAGAVQGLAKQDPRFRLASEAETAGADVVLQLDSGARFATGHVAAVLRAFQDPEVDVVVTGRAVEHGPRGSLVQRVGPRDAAPLPSQVAVRATHWPLAGQALLDGPGRRDLDDVVVAMRIGEPPAPAAVVTVIAELSTGTPVLSLREQLADFAAAGVPLIVAVGGPLRGAARAAMTRLGARTVTAATPAQARAAAVAACATDIVCFVPAGWELRPDQARALASTLLESGVGAVVPLVRDAGGSILGAGMVWADGRSAPARLLAGHPSADAGDQPCAVPAAGPEGLTMRTADLAGPLEGGAPWWAVRATAGRRVLLDPRVAVGVPRFTPPSGTRDAVPPPDLPAGDTSVAASRDAMAALGFRVVGVQPDGGTWRAVVERSAARTEPVATRRWALKIGAPPGRRGDPWGDVFFADDLAAALRSLGNDVVVDRDGAGLRPSAYLDRVVLNLRGYQVVARQPGTAHLLWIISHPEDVPVAEMRQYDRVYVASLRWHEELRAAGVEAHPLLQATNPERFRPDASTPDTGPDLLFVGNSRHQFRPIVADARAAGLHPTVIGRDWEQFLRGEEIAALSIDNADLPSAYRAAGIVLNDHWGDMVTHGFLNNRLFDAVAAGARVVSDDVPGIAEVFGDAVAVYRTPEDLGRLCAQDARGAFGTDEQRRARAAAVARDHSFLARARQLMTDAAQIPTLA
jgi:hypothetical protein